MGLLDILNGMQNGPRGQRLPGNDPKSGSGMSPLTMALLGIIAYKALKHFGGSQPAESQPSLPSGGPINADASGGGLGDILGGLLGGKPGGMSAGSRSGGSLSDMLPGGLGGLLGGAAAGSVVTGGLDKLLKEFQQSGHGKVAQSWVGTGPNQEIAPDALADALGSDTLEALTRQTGMSQSDLLAGLSQQLPELVDQLTPNGRLPTDDEARRMV